VPQATAGILSSPAAGDILADTGQLSVSTLSFTVIISTQYASRVTIALRNAANNGDIWAQLIHTSSDAPTLLQGLGSIAFALNQRLVVRAESAMIGEVQASIMW